MLSEREAARVAANRATPVYFAQFGVDGLIKIGTSTNVQQRIKNIQTVSPLPVNLLGYVLGGPTEEARLHRLFAESRDHGEWFAPTPALREYISANCLTDDPPVIPWSAWTAPLIPVVSPEPEMSKDTAAPRPASAIPDLADAGRPSSSAA